MNRLISYKGHTKNVLTGQDVYEINERTGIVKKAELENEPVSISQRLATFVTGKKIKPVYRVIERIDHSCIIATSLYKACVKFKAIYSKTHVKVKFP